MKKSLLVMALASSAMLLGSCGGNGSASSTNNSSSPDSSATGDSSKSNGSTTSQSSSQQDSSSQGGSSSQDASSSQGNSSSQGDSSSIGGNSSSSSSSSTPLPTGNIRFEGIEPAQCVLGHYFNAFDGVKAVSENGVDLTSSIHVLGSVNYGKEGSYSLKYVVSAGDISGEATRNVTVGNGTYTHPSRNRSDVSALTVNEGLGSYRTGAVELPSATTTTKNGQTVSDESNLFRRPGTPEYVDNEVFNKGPIPTNTWWSGFEHSNYGGATLAALNPLCAGFYNSGMYVSYKGTGFTQYFSVKDTFGVAQTTMSNFAPVFKDITVKPTSLATTNFTKVIGYGENNVDIAMRNSLDGTDEMVSHLVQGSPYVINEFKDPSNVQLNIRVEGVTNAYEFWDLSGKQITGDSYTGNAFVIKLPGAHYGYDCAYPSTAVGAPMYTNLYYLLKAPENSVFTFSQGQHSSPLFKQQINIQMKQGNFLSLCAMNDSSEASFYLKGAAGLIGNTHSSYAINHATNQVTTTFKNNMQFLDGNAGTPILSLMPHQWKNSSTATSAVSIKTVKGTNKMVEGDTFSTLNSFHGLLPSFTLPQDSSFSKSNASSYLDSLIADTIPDEVSLFWSDSDKHFINAPGPYWCSKALYPLSQGLIIADQCGLTTQKATLQSRLKDLLSDWYTYSGTSDKRWLYYDKVYGSMYYSVDNFSTNTRLSDHHFTSGYLIYASAVLAMYDDSFLADYGEMAKLLLKDYMNYDGDSMYPSFRSFDSYAGHSWADGYGDFGDDNDQESCGEALNSWTGAYLLGVGLGDAAMVEAAQYGFANELESIKQYWFNYDEDNWIHSLADHTHVIGINWGVKNDYATWFGSNPEFIYGIHWLPTGEYLSSYAFGDTEKATLKKIYAEFLGKVNGSPRTWYSNMWAIQALSEPTTALSNFDATKIQKDDYPDELVGSYWMVHALASFGNKDVAASYTFNKNVAATLYKGTTGDSLLVWNPSKSDETVNVVVNSVSSSVSIKARSFMKVSL